MKPSFYDASARQDSGGPSPVLGRRGIWNTGPRSRDIIEVEEHIAGLVEQSTQGLWVAWRELHRTGPPPGLSRDLLIRALAHQLQEQTHGGTSRAQRRRLQTLAREFEKAGAAFAPGVVPKTGTRLVRQWRGRTLAVLVREDGFEYEGQHYRSLTVIAERIPGAPDQTSGCCGRCRGRAMTPSAGRGVRRARVRCAIYTRKSSEEGLDQEFNSLQAQREACEAFINSQRHEGWVCLPALYDDGGFSGATMERPALQRLLADITAGRVDTVVVYKIDRLTRSLADFAKIVEILDARGASFVSVTQQFNTTTSMGRLTLNISVVLCAV